jgi:uncharacterized protein (DUF58 family)
MARKNADKNAPINDPTALARFGKLEVVAKLLVEGYIIGQHKSPFKGASVEFVEHREYYPGDEIRHIDWRAYAKTGRYYIKEFEDETNLRCYLFFDCSGSMDYGQSTLSKFDYGRQLAAALGYLLLSQRDSVGLVAFDTKVRDRFEPASSPRSFQQLTSMLENCKPGGETSLGEVIESVISTIKRRSLIILISDCFDNIEKLNSALQQFRHARHEVIVLQVVTPEEEEFPFRNPTQFRNLERSGHRVLVDPHRLRQIYVEQYNKFNADLTKHCGGLGVDLAKMTTADTYELALGAYLDARTRRKAKR